MTDLELVLAPTFGLRPRDEVSTVRRLLECGVPLSLLCDLASPQGPDSRALLEAERAPCR